MGYWVGANPPPNFFGRKAKWHTGKRHTRFGRNPRKAAKGILSALRTGRGTPRTGSIRTAISLNFGRWNAGTETFSNGTSGTGEFNEVWDETLYRRALRVPKTLDERMIEKERNELFSKAVARLPEIQRRRFLLYYEYDFNFYQIAEMEHCTASANPEVRFGCEGRKSRQK